MNHPPQASGHDCVMVQNPEGQSSVVLVCEHASSFIPPAFADLGMTGDALQSHAAWDPGALSVATGLSRRLDAVLVASKISRLVYDCNRPPTAPDAMPAQSETISIPGNMNLTPDQKQTRIQTVYDPFRVTLSATIAATKTPIIVTIHSFTPVYHGQKRDVEIGVLHDSDSRLADAMLHIASRHTNTTVQRNAPYGPQHGVTHTLKEHAISANLLNVMLEIRNDLIQTPEKQEEMAATLASWLSQALLDLRTGAPAQ